LKLLFNLHRTVLRPVRFVANHPWNDVRVALVVCRLGLLNVETVWGEVMVCYLCFIQKFNHRSLSLLSQVILAIRVIAPSPNVIPLNTSQIHSGRFWSQFARRGNDKAFTLSFHNKQTA
jgi:hypothetical protein